MMSHDPRGTTPAPRRPDHPLSGRPRLTAADQTAVDAVLGDGFDPSRPPATAREAAVTRLLGSLGRLPDAEGPRQGDPALVDATLARVERFEDDRAAGRVAGSVAEEDVVAVLPWHRNLLGAAAAIILLASLAIWTNAGGDPTGANRLTAAGVLDLPEWDAADARAFVDESDPTVRPIEGGLTGELWVLKTAGGRDRVVFVPDRDRLAARAVLRERGGTLLGRCLMRPQPPSRPASGD